MSTFAERFARALDIRGKKQADICRVTGLRSSTISHWNTGRNEPKPEGIKAIANALDVSVEWLLGYDVPMDREPFQMISPEILPDEEVVTFPIVAEVAAGFDHFALESYEGETASFPNVYLHGRPPQDFFVLKVSGDSMYPAYLDGDIVLVLKQSTLNRSGDVGVIVYDSEYASLKRIDYVMGEDWLRLVPLNPNYPPIMVAGADLERCRVLGIPKVVIREINA